VPRFSADVLQCLLDDMDRIVCSYHADVGRTGRNVADLIPGTSFFPGGTGLWRGNAYFGSIPLYFPELPVMLIGHNFDSIKAHGISQAKGGEVGSEFWKRLLGYLREAYLPPENCFFSNALMGLKPGSALGPMPSVPGYEEQCQAFLLRQIEIVAPRAIVALGGKASERIRRAAPKIPWMHAMHPSARELAPLSTRCQQITAQGSAIKSFLTALR